MVVQGLWRNICRLLTFRGIHWFCLQTFKAILCQETWLVGREHARSFKLSIHRAVADKFFHHEFLARLPIGTTYIVALSNFSLGLAFLKRCTMLPSSSTFIRSTLFWDEVGILREVSLKVRPTSFTAFVHVVAWEQELGWKLRSFSACLDLESCFSNLGKGNGVARATSSLVSHFICEVIAIHLSPVELLRKLAVWDFRVAGILLLEGLCLLNSLGEVRSFAERKRLWGLFLLFSFCLNKL